MRLFCYGHGPMVSKSEAGKMRKGIIYLFIILISGAGGFALGWFFHGDRPQLERLPVLGRAPEFTLTNQLGQAVSSTSFRGKVQIITFLFPYCREYCPLIAHNFMTLENVLQTAGIADQVQLVAFNVDPANTGPVQMKVFQQQYGWYPNDLHWQYLTGSPEEIHHIVRDAYHVYFEKVMDNDKGPQAENDRTNQDNIPEPVVSNPLADKADVDYDIVHNDMLAIVDTRGNIRRMFADADRISDEQFLDVIRELLPADIRKDER